MKTKIFIWPSDTYDIDTILCTPSGASYAIEEQMGIGGNGVVHKCIEQSTGNEYAVKFLLKYDNANKRRRRFHFECEKLKELNHQHIVTHIGSGKTPAKNNATKRPVKIDYLLMEFANGGDLQSLIKTHHPIEPEIYKAQFRGLAEALKHVHDHNLIHRDIKPENIIIIGDRWVLSDFGLAAPINRTGRDLTGNENLGPKFWMSPEMTNRCLRIKGPFSKINKPSDVFQLASVFWYVVNKRHPSGILEKNDWKGKAPIRDIIMRALDHCPKRRYRDGLEFFDAMVQAIES